MKKVLIKLLLFVCFFGTAQNFTHSLSISAKNSGLQALAVPPDLKNEASTSFNDVRIYDKDHNEVPYFTVNESFNYPSSDFKEYTISDKEIGKGRFTSFIVLNPDKKAMQNIVLCTANSDAVKLCDVVGSDDKKQWFSVSDHILMYNLFDEQSVNAYRTMSFPLVNYKYIKIVINDLHTLPLNILKVGYFEGAISAGRLNELKPLTEKIKVNKPEKTSTLVYVFKNNTIIDNINFKIKAPNYFKRQARICVNRTKTVKRVEKRYREIVFEFELNSNTNNSFDLSGFREKEFEIEISNADNPPLQFETVEFRQLQTYLVADFNAKESYTLFAGDKKLNVPNYDIAHFKNKISQFVPTLEVSELHPIHIAEAQIIGSTDKKMWQEPWFMWVCIALASFFLFLFSIRILKDMKKED
ncbi:MAG: hypothetical protein JWO32_2521 [Bacteroidetes bacterium]|nr:hypothetical protein [Bacteroidota bacterium]